MLISTSAGGALASATTLFSLPKTSSDSTASFAAKLASALEELLREPKGNRKLEIGVEAVTGQDSGDRQFVVTVRDRPRTVPKAALPVVEAAPPKPAGLVPVPSAPPAFPATPTTPATPIAGASPTAPASGGATLKLASGRPVRDEYDAYWASQPAEVQALMNLNTTDRMRLAEDLANRGFQIDVPIMVWNWDPLATMIVRRNQGFTWVPSAKQQPVQVAPGISFPGLPAYDAKNPPAGSIRVNTDFAKGFENTSPWVRYDDGGMVL